MGRVNYERTKVIPYTEESLKLDRIRELLRRLGDPHVGQRIVHIAGTKGKGSTAAMIAAACEAAGLRTGVSSSPHLERLEERFAVGGHPCTAADLVGLVERVRPIAEAMDREPVGGPTYFDLTTAMALAHFADRAVDAVVLEVGLGGRLDSTNVVTPEVAVVTSISLDHTLLLGATRDKIAVEKGGIIKPGVPAVSGVADTEAGDVLERIAAERACPFWRRGRDFDLQRDLPSDGGAWRFTRRQEDGATETIDGVAPALPGTAQAENAAVALAALGVLADRGWRLPIEARRVGVNTGRLAGRLERFEGDPTIVIDGAHNDASAAALAEALDALCGPTPRERRVLVIAVSDDKDLGAILKPLARRFGCVIATRFQDNPRAASPEKVAEEARRWVIEGAVVQTAPTPAAAWETARRRAAGGGAGGGAVVFTGSLLFAAEVRRLVVAERGAPLGRPA
ncbi:Folylpolyglutamate synthase [Botrimarina colliarenosi]|uniref:Dihydrofolate synthase/folylpolyglutamate synthase n=2 Tax=Botrimarina colliarenosi TaxID=2528001 RepID=A0A5C6ANT0_9BACT|nr:Folylpolyglutamate synthase [Botrimarina colliarenosi]